MKPSRRLAPLFFLQVIPLFLYPPSVLLGGLALIGVGIVAFLALGFLVLQGRKWALTLSIFAQGLNAIIRIMMLFPHAVSTAGGQTTTDVAWIVTSLLAIGLSGYFLLRLDRPDVQVLMTR